MLTFFSLKKKSFVVKLFPCPSCADNIFFVYPPETAKVESFPPVTSRALARHIHSRESREPHTGDGSRAARNLPAYITLAVRRETPPVVCIRASAMPATLVQTHQQQHKMPALACSRARHVGLPRSLEDLHASLLRVGARRAGISSL